MDLKNTPNYNPAFTAMKASQFKGLDYSCMRKFKAPIEKFNKMEDFISWINTEFTKLTLLKVPGRDEFVTKSREKGLANWGEYLRENFEILTPAACLLLLGAIVKGLKPSNADVLPVLNQDAIDKTIVEAGVILSKDREALIDYKRLYIDRLKENYNQVLNGWMVITQSSPGCEGYEENLRRLEVFSPRTWCTKNEKAEEYLSAGDIHIYFEEGKPQIGMRFEGDKIVDIAGYKNNGRIPQEYLEFIKEYIDSNQYRPGFIVKEQLEVAQTLKETLASMHKEIGDAIKENDVYKIMDYLGYEPQVLEEGSISIKHFIQPWFGTFEDAGIDENRLFEKISEIRGMASFKHCSATSLVNIKSILGNVSFVDSAIVDTGKLENIGGYVTFNNSRVKSIPNLKNVGSVLYAMHSDIPKEELAKVVCDQLS